MNFVEPNKELIEKLNTYLKGKTKRPSRLVRNEYLVLNGMEYLKTYEDICFWVRDNIKQRLTVKWKYRSMTFENGRRVE